MNTPLISVVVPVYGVEKYIHKCVNSLLAQDYKNLEIILVDDGSPDLCPQICDKYAYKYKNITTYHKINGGLSDARNYGVQKASADIIAFVDSDDYVESTYVSDMWKLMDKYSVDLVSCRVTRVDENGITLKNSRPFEPFVTKSPKENFFEIYFGSYGGIWAYAKLYKKSLLLRNPFPDGYYEDFAIMHKIVTDCDKVVYADFSNNYAYVQRSGSILNNTLTDKHMHCFDICDDISKFIQLNYPDLNKYIALLYQQEVVQMLNILKLTEDDMKDIFLMYRKYFRRQFFTVLKNKRAPLNRKIYITLLCTNLQTYRFVQRIINR